MTESDFPYRLTPPADDPDSVVAALRIKALERHLAKTVQKQVDDELRRDGLLPTPVKDVRLQSATLRQRYADKHRKRQRRETGTRRSIIDTLLALPAAVAFGAVAIFFLYIAICFVPIPRL